MCRLYFIFLMVIMACGCYDDKGNYDYSKLDELEIKLPLESYELLFGDKLPITPTIITDIPEEDLTYDWEFYGRNPENPDNWWKEYVSVQQGKVLDYTCLPDEYLLNGEGTYMLRLNVTQLSTGRHFYSDVVQVKLDFQLSHTGIMVLHGDDNFSDIGIIVAEEFKLEEPSSPVTEIVLPSYYSNMNGGNKIEGKGQWVKQIDPKRNTKYSDYIQVIAVTDKSSVLANSKSFVKEGDWNKLFNGGLNKGQPQTCFFNSTTVFVMDGGAVFTKLNSKPTFTKPKYDPDYSDVFYNFFPKFYVAPLTPSGRWIKGLGFDQYRQGFVAITGTFNNFNNFTLIDIEEKDGVINTPFNPGRMNAQVVYMDEGGAGKHILAVMQNNETYFLVELNTDASNSAEVPLYKYDLAHLSDVRNAVSWAFFSGINMCFYATPDGVKQFAVDDGHMIKSEALMTTTNEKVQFDGMITMMKILKTEANSYYKSGEEMVVATYGGTPGSGKLYSIELDRFSGRVKSVKTYTGFDRICDVNLKGW